MIQYGFGTQGTARGRDLAAGDLDGDGLTDIVVTETEGRSDAGFSPAPGTKGLTSEAHFRAWSERNMFGWPTSTAIGRQRSLC